MFDMSTANPDDFDIEIIAEVRHISNPRTAGDVVRAAEQAGVGTLPDGIDRQQPVGWLLSQAREATEIVDPHFGRSFPVDLSRYDHLDGDQYLISVGFKYTRRVARG